MAKTFEARISKKERASLDLTSNIDPRILKLNDDKLLQGARLDEIRLDKIVVRAQVRTKFNDESIRELAENIKLNGLIQPLVVHREGDKYVLICGERRFRAMTTMTDMVTAPCFILENKTDEELMAIQFSENSAREQLHYIDQADSIYGYKKLTGHSERKIQAALGISKSEVHRCLLIAKVPKDLKEAAKEFDTEKYVLLEWDELPASKAKDEIRKKIVEGKITKRLQLKRAIKTLLGDNEEKEKKVSIPKKKNEDLLLLLQEKAKNLKMDKKTKDMLSKLLKDSELGLPQ